MRSSLELLLLSLVHEGLGNAYELKTRSDISLGSTVPALARLKSDGLLAESKEARRSLRYTLTVAGAKALETGWVEQLQSTSSDIESILRTAFIAWRHGDPETAANYLYSAAEHLRSLSVISKAESTRFRKRSEEVGNDSLRWLRARVEARRLRAEAEELTALARELRAMSSSGRRVARRSAPKKVQVSRR